MSTTTINYNFIKPSLQDTADITQTNPNWDNLDDMLYIMSEGFAYHMDDKNNPHGITAEQIGAAKASLHNIPSYTNLSQLSLKSSDFSTTNFENNIKGLCSRIPSPGIVSLVESIGTNLGMSIVDKLSADLKVSTSSMEDLNIIIFKTNNGVSKIDVFLPNGHTRCGEIYTCVYRESGDTISNFILSFAQEGLSTPKYIDYTIKADGWLGASAPYSYIIPLYEGQTVEVLEDVLMTMEQLEVLENAKIKSDPREEANILFAFGEKPTIDIPVVLAVH